MSDMFLRGLDVLSSYISFLSVILLMIPMTFIPRYSLDF